MALIPLKVPAGVYRAETELQSAGRWYDANLVRWFQNAMQPVGGWRSRSSSAVAGRPSGLFAWRGNSLDRYVAVGTEQKLYVYEGGSTRYDITPTGYSGGRASAISATGYGAGKFGSYAYGVARPNLSVAGILPATAWALDNFGQYLLACANTDGKIYQWDLNLSAAATTVTNAPTSNQSVMTTDERFVFALGAGGNPRKVQWADQESLTDWTPSATNQAGDSELQTAGTIVCGRRTRGGALILTTTDAHFAKYIGLPFVYSFERVGTGCGVVGANAVAAIESGAVWMGTSGFWLFDGYAKPLPCEVADYVFGDINDGQISKVACVHNSEFGEVWWMYPSSESTENDRYVVWNYRENHWTIGEMARTVGTGQGVFELPLMMSVDGYLYEHEVGWNYDGAQPYVESGPVQIGNGDMVMHATMLIPDEKTAGDVRVKFKTKFYPNAAEQTFGPYSMSSPTDVRFAGREVKMRIEPAVNDAWRVGTMRLDAVAGGKR